MAGRSGRSSPSVWLLVVLLVVGAGGTAVAFERVRSDARAADRMAAETTAERLAAGLGGSVAALQGVDVMAADGNVSAAEFEALASDIVPSSDYLALAYSDVVPDAELPGWQRSTGLEARDTDGAGGFQPSAGRASHAPIRLAYPVNETTQRVLGFDILSDATRASGAAQALDGGQSAVVGPIALATNARPGLFVIRAVRTPSGEPVGFVSSGIGVDSLLRRLPDQADRPPLALNMDGKELLVEAGTRGPTAAFTIGGRIFTVQTEDGGSPSYLLPLLLLGATAGFAVLALQAGRREHAAQREQRVRAARSERLAEFAEDLSTVDSRDQVVDFTVSRVGSLVDADHTNFGRTEPGEPGKLIVAHDRGIALDLADRFAIQDLESHLPLTDCAREQKVVALAGLATYTRDYPDVVDVVRDAGVRAVLCVPLNLGGGSAGVIGFAWRRELSAGEMERACEAGELAAQLVGRAYERARAREFVQLKIDELGAFTRRLTESRTSTEITDAVSEQLPALFDAESAVLRDEPLAGEAPGVHRYPVGSRLTLELVGHPLAPWPPAADSLAHTVADLLDAGLTRAALYDQERAVLDRLQRSLLLPAPEVEGYEVAVAYRSAVEAVGIGGDWYSLVDTPHRLYAVIADVAGHGPAAVAVMAEAKAVLRHVLTTDVGPLEAVEQVNSVLLRRNAYASMVLVEIDKASGNLRYVNAGHPPPMVVDGEVRLLDQEHGAWLGLPTSNVQPLASARLDEGETLFLYTDGLIEERGELLDLGIGRLAERAAVLASSPASLVERLLEERATGRSRNAVDDDIALLAIRRGTAPPR